jgi:hypothetical protein
MATTTPNYGWTVPTSTDLVKDGATAIETLGDAIDASMNTALGTKKAGMVLLNTTSFSAVSSVSLPAGTFTTDYDNFRIVGRVTGMSTNAMLARMRASGSDNTTTNHVFAAFYVDTTTSAVDFNGTSQTSLTLSRRDSEFYIDINGPAQVRPTTFQGRYYDRNQGRWGMVGANQTQNLSFDSMTFFPAASTFSGEIFCYAYNK